jgi:hypothetical protein
MRNLLLSLVMLAGYGYGSYYTPQGKVLGRSYTNSSGYTNYYSPGGSRLGSAYRYGGSYQYRYQNGSNAGSGPTKNWKF